jgi:15-cis-phytoene synthase
MDDAFAYCADVVRSADKDRYLASLFAPAQHREALYALYAFDIEVSRVRDLAREPMPGEVRLQWWTDVLNGERSGEASAHPVAAALLASINRHVLPVEVLLAHIDAHTFDLYDEPMGTIADLEDYALKTSSSVIALAMRILGDGSGFGDIARPAGIAFAFTRLLFAFPAHAARRQFFVPGDLLARQGATVEFGEATPELRRAIGDIRDIAAAHLASVGRIIPGVPATVLPALLPLAVTRLQLDRLKRVDYDPFTPPDVPQWRRQWAIWRAARNGKRVAG